MSDDRELEYEYEQGEDVLDVTVEFTLEWESADKDVGIMSDYAVVDSLDAIYVNGTKVAYNMATRDWALDRVGITDPEAFMKDLDKRLNSYAEEAERP
jgi:hypothetical protein